MDPKRSPWLYACALISLVIGLFLVHGGGTIDTTARFPQLSLSGETNIVADNGSMWTFNGVPFCTNCGATINPTDAYLPYRVDASSYGDSPLWRGGTNTVGQSSSTVTNASEILSGAFYRRTWAGNRLREYDSVGAADSVFNLYDPSGLAYLNTYLASNASYMEMYNNGAIGWRLNPSLIDGGGTPYLFNGSISHTSGDYIASTNAGSKIFAITWDGTIYTPSFRTSSTNWDDSQVPEAMVRVGATAPTLANFNGGPVQTLQFQNNRDDTIMATVQMTHRWKQGTDIHPHVHWCETATTGAGTNVVWQLTYAWTNVNCAYPAYTTLKITNSVTGTNWFSQLSDFPDITGTGHLVSSIFVFELRRLANTATADDYNQNVAFLGFDIHHQVDSPGSDSELTKSW